MEKIKGFQISSMTVSGFKCYEAPMEITFGNPTIVTGGNGRGKSSLADAIAFAVTGLPFFGERGIDRLHNETNPDLQITMRFTDDTGKAHELTRSRQKDRMSITYDGYAIRQTDLGEKCENRKIFLFGVQYADKQTEKQFKMCIRDRLQVGLRRFDLMSRAYKPVYEVMTGFAKSLPQTDTVLSLIHIYPAVSRKRWYLPWRLTVCWYWRSARPTVFPTTTDRKSTRLNSSH